MKLKREDEALLILGIGIEDRTLEIPVASVSH